MQAFTGSKMLPLIYNQCWTKVLLYTKLTHKCIIVVLCSSALIMHFKTLSSQGSIKGIRYHRSIKSTVCFLTRKKLQLKRESTYAMYKTINLSLKILAKKRAYSQCIWMGGGLPKSKRLLIHTAYSWQNQNQYSKTCGLKSFINHHAEKNSPMSLHVSFM